VLRDLQEHLKWGVLKVRAAGSVPVAVHCRGMYQADTLLQLSVERTASVCCTACWQGLQCQGYTRTSSHVIRPSRQCKAAQQATSPEGSQTMPPFCSLHQALAEVASCPHMQAETFRVGGVNFNDISEAERMRLA
jgi:hypothetical protein